MKGIFFAGLKKPTCCAAQSKHRPYRWIARCRLMTSTGVCWAQWDSENNDLWQGQYQTCPAQEVEIPDEQG